MAATLTNDDDDNTVSIKHVLRLRLPAQKKRGGVSVCCGSHDIIAGNQNPTCVSFWSSVQPSLCKGVDNDDDDDSADRRQETGRMSAPSYNGESCRIVCAAMRSVVAMIDGTLQIRSRPFNLGSQI